MNLSCCIQEKTGKGIGFFAKDIDNLKLIYHLVKERRFTIEVKQIKKGKDSNMDKMEIGRPWKELEPFNGDKRIVKSLKSLRRK